MASKRKQKGMVFHQEGAPAPPAALTADHPRFGVTKPGSGDRMERRSHVAKDQASDGMGRANTYPSRDRVRTSDGLPAVKRPASSDKMSPDPFKGVTVTLDNLNMWNEFFRCRTEMILTKQGSRMFPYCRFRISGLQPSSKYSLFMDVQPLDNSRYKWTGKTWQVAGKAEPHVKSPPFAHPESPSTGQHWMQNPVSFYKLKLTNSDSEQEGNTVLHPMHRYLPRLHLVHTDKPAKDIKLSGPNVITFAFPQTEFMAVTAYQNSRLSQLKVDYNPFAKGLKEDGAGLGGLKLKPNSGKGSRKEEDVTTNDQHPVKKSLKSLLANHKPRSSKAPDAKPSGSGDQQKSSTSNVDASAGSPRSTSRPAQKLFSELIREAHVSLHRCDQQQLGINNSTLHRTEPTATKTTALKSNDVPRTSARTQGKGSSAKRKSRQDKDLLDSSNCKDSVKRDPSGTSSGSQNSSVNSDHQGKPDAPSEAKVKQAKRPLPLPALALFLKQHSKSKKAKQDSPSHTLPSDSAPTSPPSGPGFLRDLSGETTKSDNQASEHTEEHLCPKEIVLNVTDQAVDTAQRPSSRSSPHEGLRADGFQASPPAAESSGSELAVPDGTSVFPNSSPSFCTLGSSIPIGASTPAASQPLDTVLRPPDSPQAATINESSSPPLNSPTAKSDCLLPDPECSPFGFESLSPASSPEPLPSLSMSLAFDLDSTTSESKAVSPEGLHQPEDSSTSVFKWHTVLPLPEPFLQPSFSTFQPQTVPLAADTSNSEPQTLDTSMPPPHPDPGPGSEPGSEPGPDPAPSFQEHEQHLSFPAELSPLQMPLSPTFSSLDGGGLSPTPSITDLVQFFSINGDLGMGMEFPNAEAAVPVPIPPPSLVEAPELPQEVQQVQPTPTNKPCKHKKKSRQRKPSEPDQKVEASTYSNMQPNLEEVEEQLFISFTSKEALKLHLTDSDGTTPEGQPPQTTDAPENASAETSHSPEETISGFQKLLLRDLKLMRHSQVIHPVLQEVGLKMNLLDPTLVIDLQYLGVRLPLPPPGASLDLLPPPQDVSAAFVSRTGKTSDVTQIKGWREKYTPSEAPPPPPPALPLSPTAAAGPSSDPPKKNLSAFCSDMLDEYLENEGKLIDERAASFSQPVVEPVVYVQPTRSTSYVRTLDSVLKKQTTSSPTSDLISGFIPPSKRPKLTLKDTKIPKKRGPKPKPRPEPGPGSTPALNPAESNLVLKPSEPTELRKDRFQDTDPGTHHPRRRKKPRTSSQTLSPHRLPEDMAPLESDSELGTGQSDETKKDKKDQGPVMTRALLRQRDLEDSVVWEGRPRTSITEERAAIALTSLFTLKGFVRENPTAPIQLGRRRVPPCLSESCRLGCICSSLAHTSRISHCGRPQCMLGCSCLKQKVVLLKNLDCSDSSPSHHGHNKRKKRRKRMKMAYVLKEADSVTQPAERVRTLWRRGDGDLDPEPIHVPGDRALTLPTPVRPAGGEPDSSCARVRGFVRRKTSKQKRNPVTETPKKVKVKQRDATLTRPPPPGDPVQSNPPPDPKPSKRLTIMAGCKFGSDTDRNLVLRMLCEAMALDRLDKPFWVGKYLISPISQTLEESDGERCTHYQMHITRPTPGPQGARPSTTKPQPPSESRPELQNPEVPEAEPLEYWQREVEEDEEEEPPPLEEWQREVEEEEEEDQEEEPPPPIEDWQREVKEEVKEEELEEAEPVEHLQQDLEEGEVKEGVAPTKRGRKRGRQETEVQKKTMVGMGLPFLTGVSAAGFLSANRKQPGGTDQLVQVNGKLYPLAKIQLGKMGALHPANRLAAYLTGRVGANRKPQTSSKPPQSSAPTVPAVSTPPPRPQPPAPPPTAVQPAAPTVVQSAAVGPPTAEATKKVGTRVVMVKVFPGVKGSSNQVRVVPAPSAGSAPPPGPQASSLAAPKGPQMMVFQVPPPPGKLPVPGPTSCLPAPQTMLLQPVQTASGAQYFRRQDGKLVKLVPISQLAPGNQKVLPPTSLQTPGSTKLTSLLSGSSPFSGFQSFNAAPLLTADSSLLTQKGACTFKILPSSSKKSPFVVTCPKLPKLPVASPPPAAAESPTKLITPKPPTVPGPEGGIKTVTVSPSLVPVHLEPVVQTPAETPAPAEVLVVPPAEPATDLMDLDIISVDDEGDFSSPERVGGAKPPPVLKSETDSTSDSEDDMDGDEQNVDTQRYVHNFLEKQRRSKLHQLFEGLRKEVGLRGTKTSKQGTLNKAVQVIQELRAVERHLERKRRRLIRKNNKYMSIIVPTSENQSESSLTSADRETGSDDTDSMDMMDGLTENSSDEERPITKATGEESPVTKVILPKVLEPVAMETVPQTKPVKTTKNVDSNALKTKKEVGDRSVTSAFRTLKSALNSSSSSRSDLLQLAHQEIQRLLMETMRLRSLKICLNQQRENLICHVSKGSGKSKELIQEELQKKAEHPTANQLPAAEGGGASVPPSADPTDDLTSSDLKTSQAPPTAPAPAPAQQPPRVLQVLNPVLVPPGVSHNAPAAWNRPRTVPNILSRSKTASKPRSFQAVVPTNVLSLVGGALPGQQVLAVSPLVQAAPSPAVTLSLDQQIHVTSLTPPPVGKIFGSSAPLTVTDLTDLLHLVQPSTTQQPQQVLQQVLQPAPQVVQLQQVLAPPPQPHWLPTGPPLQVSALSDLMQDQDQDQAEASPQGGPSSSPGPGPEVVGPPVGAAPEPGDDEGLTSLLNEIVFLNQLTGAAATTDEVTSPDEAPRKDSSDQGQDHSPGSQDLDSDSVDQTKTSPASSLAPPPLLQMKVGVAKEAEPASSSSLSGGDSGGGGGVARDGGVAWRPMPRLVPLGLRGNPP